MKQIVSMIAFVLMVVVLSGCSTVQTGENFNNQALFTDDKGVSVAPISHINVRMNGCYVLGFIPLWAGSPEKDGDFEMFSNTIKVKNAVGLLTKKSKELGSNRVVDLRSQYTEKPVWILISTFWVSVREVQVSATCTK